MTVACRGKAQAAPAEPPSGIMPAAPMRAWASQGARGRHVFPAPAPRDGPSCRTKTGRRFSLSPRQSRIAPRPSRQGQYANARYGCAPRFRGGCGPGRICRPAVVHPAREAQPNRRPSAAFRADRTYLCDNLLHIAHRCATYGAVHGSELVRKLRRLAKERGLEFSYEPRHGKGSHGQLFFGDKLTTVKDPKKEIGSGLLHDMLKQLDLKKEDLS
jgi:mRNA interferase HicA